jgi:phosphoglycerate dehydrogenase-like enzyme
MEADRKPLCYVGIAMHPQARRELEEVFEVTQDEGRMDEAEAAICYGVPSSWTEGNAACLKAIGCHSCGEAEARWAKERGIRMTLADGLWRTVAEHTLALMLAAARNLIPADRRIREGKWTEHVRIKEQFSGVGLEGKTLGILGMGQIGTQLAELVSGFRMNVLYYDIRRLPEQEEQRLKASAASLDEVLAAADFLCVLLPLQEDTRGMLGKEAFLRMKKGCILVNTARAGIIEEEAFLEALCEGDLAGAALDVFWEEGCPQRKELTACENVVLSPHLGGSTYECDMELVNGVIGAIRG